MPSYLIEAYSADSDAVVAAARATARRTAEIDAEIRWLRSTLVPDDETILHLFEAPTLDALCKAASRAGLRFDRAVEVIEMEAPA
ncbi:MAG: DUF4242 domain-containing protein [Gaiellales bacterium]